MQEQTDKSGKKLANAVRETFRQRRSPQISRARATHVYVIEADDGRVKVGISRNPRQRDSVRLHNAAGLFPMTFRSIPYVWAAFLVIAVVLMLSDWMGLVCITLLRDAHP